MYLSDYPKGMTIYKRAKPAQSKTKGRHSMYTGTKDREWRKQIKEYIDLYNIEPIPDGPVRMDITFYFKLSQAKIKQGFTAGDFHYQRPDRDNLMKNLQDALNGLIYKDDCQICSGPVDKCWGTEDKIVIKVNRL